MKCDPAECGQDDITSPQAVFELLARSAPLHLIIGSRFLKIKTQPICPAILRNGVVFFNRATIGFQFIFCPVSLDSNRIILESTCIALWVNLGCLKMGIEVYMRPSGVEWTASDLVPLFALIKETRYCVKGFALQPNCIASIKLSWQNPLVQTPVMWNNLF